MEDSMTVSNDEYILSISREENAVSPRTWDNLGKMVCWHSRYALGDKHEYANPQEFRKSNEYKNAVAVLPVYLYDHSGITISNTDFQDEWDSGQVGYIYATKDSIRKYLGKEPSEVDENDIIELLKNETKTYDQYLQGDIYCFVIENKTGEVVDSCSGFYGDDIREVLHDMRDSSSEEYTELFDKMSRHSAAYTAMM